ncbi:MAG TPA: hypothetical protein VKA38_05225 [Draconibacterium sp.]|nr:hypothetical protein [Draconibacterium sp.]
MKKVMLVVGAIVFIASGILAQEVVKPAKFENVTWHNVVLVNYKPGKISRVKEIIKIYKAAGAEAQTKGPEEYWFSTGEYDAMFIWTMEGGPSDMEWYRNSNDIKWRAAMIKQLGSEEALEKLQEEYSNLVSNSTNYISRKQM